MQSPPAPVLSLPEPVPHPALSASPTPLLRVLLGETPSSFRALLFGPAPASGALLASRLAALSLEAEHRRLVDFSRSSPRRAERHRAARLARLLRALLDRGSPQLFLTALPLLDELRLADLPEGPALARLQREVAAASAALAADLSSAPARVRLRRAVFAHVAACRRWIARHDPLHPDPSLCRRVDFSAAAPIAPEPALPLDRCGLPLAMAFGLFELHLVGETVRRGLAPSPAAARRIVANRPAALIPILETILADHPVLVTASGRAGVAAVQGFFPVLAEGRALRLAPAALVRLLPAGEDCVAKIFLPLGERAREETCQRVMSPATGVVPEGAEPAFALSPDATLGLFLDSLSRPGASLERRTFTAVSFAEVERALDAGALDIDDHVLVRHHGRRLSTIAGRCAVMALLPPEMDPARVNVVLDRPALVAIVTEAAATLGPARAARLVMNLEALGLARVTARGVSLAADDLVAPASKQARLDEVRREHALVAQHYEAGLITDGERYNKVIDIWATLADRLASEAVPWPRPGQVPEGRLARLVASGVAGNRREAAAIAAMRGVPAKPSGELHEVPIVASLAEGMSSHEAFMLAMEARGRRVGAWQQDREDRRLALLLVQVLGGVRIVTEDCGALGALPLGSLADSGGDLFTPLADRIRGRTVVDTSPDGRVQAVRSPVFCEAEGGVCAVCYGTGPGSALPTVGEQVGLHAARALAMHVHRIRTRPFHIGCLNVISHPFDLEEIDPELLSRFSPWRTVSTDGVIAFEPPDPDAVAVTPAGDRVVMVPWLGVLVIDDGVVTARGGVPRGALLRVAPGERVERGQLVADWDDYHVPLIAQQDGTVRWEELDEGISVQRRVESVTGLERDVVIEPDGSSARPRLAILSPEGEVRQTIALHADHQILARDGARVARGETVARRPLYLEHFPSAPRGRPDLLSILHGKIDDPAVLCEIAGLATVTEEPDRSCTITVRPTKGSPEIIAAGTRCYQLARWSTSLVESGDYVAAGAKLRDGETDPEALARIFGPAVAARYLVDLLQLVYALFRIPLDVRHAEIVARALLRFVRVRDPGDSPFAEGELVSRARFAHTCDALAARGPRSPSAAIAITGLAVQPHPERSS